MNNCTQFDSLVIIIIEVLILYPLLPLKWDDDLNLMMMIAVFLDFY